LISRRAYWREPGRVLRRDRARLRSRDAVITKDDNCNPDGVS